jgi:hypothetical protein
MSEAGWGRGDHILVDLPDGQTVRCRIVNVKDDGTIQVMNERLARAVGGEWWWAEASGYGRDHEKCAQP